MIDQRLRERHGGLIEGTTEEERREKWGDHWQSLDLQVESDTSVKKRAIAALEDMLINYPNKNLLIVSHTALIEQLIITLAPEKKGNLSLKNCSITVFATHDETWELKIFNDDRHMR